MIPEHRGLEARAAAAKIGGFFMTTEKKNSWNNSEPVGIEFSGPMGNIRKAAEYLKERGITPLPAQLFERNGRVEFRLSDPRGRHLDFVRKDEGVVWAYARNLDAARESPRTFDLKDVEVFRAGRWADSAGRETEYTREDLERMAAAHAELADRFDAPVKLGHGREQDLLSADGLPAAGWLHNIRAAGDSLLADIKDIPKKVYDIMRAGGFRKRSLEVLHNFRIEDDGRVYPHVVAGLALLGAKLPALSLSDIRNFYTLEESGADYPYSFEDVITGKTNGGEEPMDQKLEELAAKIDELAAKLDSLAERLDALEVEEAAGEPGAVEDAAPAADPSDAAEFMKHLAKKMPPADRAPFVLHFERLSGAARTEFGEFVRSLPDAAELAEYGRHSGDARGAGEPDGQESRIRRYCALNNLDPDNAAHYARAAMAVCDYVKPE